MEGDAIYGLLCAAADSERARELTGRLLASFITPAGVFEAPRELLVREGLTEQEAAALHAVPDFARCFSRSASRRRTRILRCADALGPLTEVFLGRRREEFCVLCLDGRGLLLEARTLGEGTADRAPAYVRNILSAVSETRSSVIIASHNHPGGTPEPSKEDVSLTLRILSSVCPLGASLADHLIFCGGSLVSMRLGGFLSRDVWEAQPFPEAFRSAWR